MIFLSTAYVFALTPRVRCVGSTQTCFKCTQGLASYLERVSPVTPVALCSPSNNHNDLIWHVRVRWRGKSSRYAWRLWRFEWHRMGCGKTHAFYRIRTSISAMLESLSIDQQHDFIARFIQNELVAERQKVALLHKQGIKKTRCSTDRAVEIAAIQCCCGRDDTHESFRNHKDRHLQVQRGYSRLPVVMVRWVGQCHQG